MPDLLPLLLGLLAGALATAAILLPRLRAERGAVKLIEDRLASALRERQELQAELDAAQEALATRSSAIDAENEELRRRMDEIADLIMARGEPRND